MFPRQIARKFYTLSALVVVLLLTSAPPIKATTPELPTAVEIPKYTIKPFGPYRVFFTPKAKRTPVKSTTTIEKEPPKPPTPKWSGNKYQIKSGDTLSTIAPHLGYTFHELATCSGIANPHRISIGQVIHKPGSCVPPPPRPKPKSIPAADAPVQRASGIVETVIAFAMAQLGDPYVWGANGPNAWDCSGLVHAAFRHAGISVTRTTKTLINEGSPVGRTSLQRGDLVFPHRGHVGIYVGNNQMVHAPQAGDVVKVGSVYSFWAARRIA